MENNLFDKLCSYENLELAYKKARKRKTLKRYVIEFEKNLKQNLLDLRNELIFHTYKPKPLETFIVHDPKTRKISKSHFRDRVVHHALCNIIEPTFEKYFIFDSYANRIGKGTHKAIERFDYFKRKVSKNNSRNCFILKADIRHYFETVNHRILLSIVKKKIPEERVLWLVKLTLSNHKAKENEKGMPLGNLTSQFFANVYLNELDNFIKHKLRAKYYIRYVDDFVILDSSRKILEEYKSKINEFLSANLDLELHSDKSNIFKLDNGAGFLGFRIFYFHKLVRKQNIRKFERKFEKFNKLYKKGIVSREKVVESFESWLAHISHADTYKYRRYLIKVFNQCFPLDKNTKIANTKKYENFVKKVKISRQPFSSQKTLFLFKKELRIKEIAEKRNIKESTVWWHFAKLIEYNQLSIWEVLSKENISKILYNINSLNDKLRDIKERLNDSSITFNEINCVLTHLKNKTKGKATPKEVNEIILRFVGK